MTGVERDRHGRILAELGRVCGIDLIGIADASVLEVPPGLPRLPVAVVLGLRLSRAVLDTLVDGPTLLYLHHYRQVNAQLDRAATVIAADIERRGYQALPLPASQIVDWKRMAGLVSHKALARQAGLGWRGRNNLLVTPALGSQVRLASIITDFPLVPGRPIEADCGPCRACIPVCPAGAIAESAAVFNLEACYAKLDEFRKSKGVQQHICGLCVRACAGGAK